MIQQQAGALTLRLTVVILDSLMVNTHLQALPHTLPPWVHLTPVVTVFILAFQGADGEVELDL